MLLTMILVVLCILFVYVIYRTIEQDSLNVLYMMPLILAFMLFAVEVSRDTILSDLVKDGKIEYVANKYGDSTTHLVDSTLVNTYKRVR